MNMDFEKRRIASSGIFLSAQNKEEINTCLAFSLSPYDSQRKDMAAENGAAGTSLVNGNICAHTKASSSTDTKEHYRVSWELEQRRLALMLQETDNHDVNR